MRAIAMHYIAVYGIIVNGIFYFWKVTQRNKYFDFGGGGGGGDRNKEREVGKKFNLFPIDALNFNNFNNINFWELLSSYFLVKNLFLDKIE